MMRSLPLASRYSLGAARRIHRAASLDSSRSPLLPTALSLSSTGTWNEQRRSIHVERRLEELQIVLPPAPSPKANYNIVCYTNNNSILYVSGHLPLQADGTLWTGRIGPASSGGLSIDHGYQAARHVGLNIIATLKEQLGDLDRVQQIVKVNDFVGRYFKIGECECSLVVELRLCDYLTNASGLCLYYRYCYTLGIWYRPVD
jgi:enamine deaminase RidA (YjgF/YER057c/UK114 family)